MPHDQVQSKNNEKKGKFLDKCVFYQKKKPLPETPPADFCLSLTRQNYVIRPLLAVEVEDQLFNFSRILRRNGKGSRGLGMGVE